MFNSVLSLTLFKIKTNLKISADYKTISSFFKLFLSSVGLYKLMLESIFFLLESVLKKEIFEDNLKDFRLEDDLKVL